MEGIDGRSIGDLQALLSRSCEEADPNHTGAINLDRFAQMLRSTELPSLDHHTVRRLVESVSYSPPNSVEPKPSRTERFIEHVGSAITSAVSTDPPLCQLSSETGVCVCGE